MIHHRSGKITNERRGHNWEWGSNKVSTNQPWVISPNNAPCSLLCSKWGSPGLIDEFVRKLGKLGQILSYESPTWISFLAKGNR